MTDAWLDELIAVKNASHELAKSKPEPKMWVYIDDSGDGSTHPEATSHLVMSACVFRSPKDIEHARQVADGVCDRLGIRKELKFAKARTRAKKLFFERMAEVNFDIRAIVIDKDLIYASKYRENPSMMKALAITQLLTHGFGQLRNAKVFIDGHDTKAFGIPDAQHFLQMASEHSPGAVQEVKFENSARNRMVQVADMHAGAILAKVRRDKPQKPHYFQSFRGRLYQPRGTLWHFR